jgi:hypothetical protein
MSDKVLIEAWFGSERMFGKSASLGVMWVPPAGSGTREVFLAVAKPHGVDTIKNTDFEAFPGKIEDFGKWRQGMFQVPESAVLRVKASKSSQTFGSMAVAASLYLKPRANAAMRDIAFKATGQTGCYRDTYNVRGRFDILTKEELEEFAGELPRWILPEISERQTRAAFTVTEVSPELAARPLVKKVVIQDAAGNAVELTANVRTRRVRI